MHGRTPYCIGVSWSARRYHRHCATDSGSVTIGHAEFGSAVGPGPQQTDPPRDSTPCDERLTARAEAMNTAAAAWSRPQPPYEGGWAAVHIRSGRSEVEGDPVALREHETVAAAGETVGFLAAYSGPHTLPIPRQPGLGHSDQVPQVQCRRESSEVECSPFAQLRSKIASSFTNWEEAEVVRSL